MLRFTVASPFASKWPYVLRLPHLPLVRLGLMTFLNGLLLIGCEVAALVPTACGQDMRARDLGVPFEGVPSPLNAITDVPGVEVGHVPF